MKGKALEVHQNDVNDVMTALRQGHHPLLCFGVYTSTLSLSVQYTFMRIT